MITWLVQALTMVKTLFLLLLTKTPTTAFIYVLQTANCKLSTNFAPPVCPGL